jgi:RNA polymerase sigma factor (sigma-70 family)
MGVNEEDIALTKEDLLILNSVGEELVEEDLDLIKNSPNTIWYKYDEKIRKLTTSLGYWKNFDSNELYQQSYIYFVDFCKNYNPYYNGGFIPFDKYLFKNLIIKLRAFIQSYYFKRKREQPTDFHEQNHGTIDNSFVDKKLDVEYLYTLISDRQGDVLRLASNGFKQQEIGEMLNISQSRVSVIRKKAIKKLQDKIEKD